MQHTMITEERKGESCYFLGWTLCGDAVLTVDASLVRPPRALRHIQVPDRPPPDQRRGRSKGPK